MTSRFFPSLPLATLFLVAGCHSPLAKTPAALGTEGVVKAGVKPRPVPSGLTGPGGSAGIISRDGAGIISRDGAGIISRDGAGIISRDGAGIISRDGAGIGGVAKLPAGIISRDGAGIISRDGAGIISRDGAGYRLAALPAEVPVRSQLVYLMNAEGKLVVGADGEPMTATTDASGRFEFKGFVNQKHLLFAIKLYDDKGLLTTIVPRSNATSRTLGLDLASTLTATYIQEKYVKPQRDPVAVLERLPVDLEAATRGIVSTAAAKLDKAPADLTASGVVGLVDRLRTQDKTVDDQFVEVRRVLLAGLSDQGAGQPINTLETDASDLALNPSGELAFASPATLRVWRKDTGGRLAVVAGTGFLPGGTTAVGAAAPGDGGAATSAPMSPAAIAYMPDGTLLIADKATQRIRKVGTNGVITTVAASADWTELRDLVIEPDGGLLVATHSAIWRVPAGGQPTLLAGASRAFDPDHWAESPSTGDGGQPLDARFRSILNIARDPRNGDIVVFDAGGLIRRVTATAIARIAGADTPGYAGDGGPAAQAQFGVLGGVAVRADGTIVVADATNHRLREVSNGTVSTVAGTGLPTFAGEGGPATSAGVYEPEAPLTAPDGGLYFIDHGYVRQLANGTLRTMIGGTRNFDVARPATEVQLLAPRGLSYDAASNVIRVEDDRHVWRWTLDDNKMLSEFGGPPGSPGFTNGQLATKTGLSGPRSVVNLGANRWAALVSDPTTFLARVVLVEDGKMTSLAGGATALDTLEMDVPADGAAIIGMNGALFELDGWYYYSTAIAGRIRRFQPGGKTEAWGGYGTSASSSLPVKDYGFGPIAAMAKGPDGLIYVASPNYIYRVDPATNAVTFLAGSKTGLTTDGGQAKATKLYGPSAFAWDAAGHTYFSEPSQGVIRRIRKDADVVERVAGAGTPNLSGQTVDTGLGSPMGIVFDKAGNLYVADSRHGQIKIVRKSQLAP